MKKLYLLLISVIAITSVFIGYKFINAQANVNNYNKNYDSSNERIINNKTDINNNKSLTEKYKTSSNKLLNDNKGIPVLYYHSVNQNSTNEVIITPKLLKEHLSYLKDEGYTSLTMSDLAKHLIENEPIPEKSVLITFDDGYMDNYYNAFPILKELNLTATIFCIANDLNGEYYLAKNAIKEMSDYGIDIQSHTVNHPHLNQLTYSEQLKEMINSKKILEEILKKEVYAIAYPFGDFNEDTIKAAKEAGYKLGFTTNRGLSDKDDNLFKLDRIYISSNYNLDTFKTVLKETQK